ncbi:MAG: type II toxin-antitoxin system VapC family toxin [Terracidiphilus sp.]|jgi:predicted nucleic acid-binding protein
MNFLLDTNVVSELRKPHPHGAVLAWRRSLQIHQIAIPGVVLAETQAGVELTRKQDPQKAAELEAWIDQVQTRYTILPADGTIFREWARLMYGRSPNLSADAMIAATARVLGLIVATRNRKDFEPFQVQVFNPFEFNQEEKN